MRNPEFTAGIDYELYDNDPFSNSGEYCKVGTYRISLPTAKRVAMAEHNEAGALVRGYFIWVETQFLNQQPPRMTKEQVRAMFEDELTEADRVLKGAVCSCYTNHVHYEHGCREA